MPYMTPDNMKPIVDDILKRQREGRAQEYHVPFVIESLAVYADKGMQYRPAEGVVDTLTEQCGRLYIRNKSLTKGHSTLTRRVQELEKELAYYRNKYPRTLSFDENGVTVKEGDRVLFAFGKIKEEPPFKDEDGQVFLKDALISDQVPTEQKQVVFQAAPKRSSSDQAQQIIDNAMQAINDSKLFEDLRAEQHNRQLAETQLQKAVGELSQRLDDLEFAASAGHHSLDGVTGSQVMAAERFNAAVRQQITDSLTPGGIIYNALKK